MKKRILALVLILILLFSFTGCTLKMSPNPTEAPSVEVTVEPTATPRILTDSEKLKGVTDALFDDVIRTDFMSCYMYLRDRSAYADMPRDFGNHNYETDKVYFDLVDKSLNTLKDINYDKLTYSEKVSYDSIKQELLNTQQYYKKFYYYSSALNSLTGIQSSLPLTFSLMEFYNKKDVEDYLALLGSVKSYYQNIIASEQKRAELGLMASDENLEKIIQSCKDNIADKKTHFLITTFDDRINAAAWLTGEEKTALMAANLEKVQNVIFPAYDYLIDELGKLKGKNVNKGGVCNYADGKEYYEILFKFKSSTDLSVSDAIKLLESNADKAFENMIALYQKDKNIFDKIESEKFSKGTPQQNIDYLKKAIEKDYPQLPEHTLKINDLPKSLEDSFSPAAYITPPIDDLKSNNIILNNKSFANCDNVIALFAHEGYPGHLYQTVFSYTSDMDKYRKVANFVGFSEGWAQFSETYALRNSGYDKNLTELYINYSMLYNTCLPARIDIGVNYEGWDLSKTKEYLKKYSLSDAFAQYYYDRAIEMPCYHVKYSIGFIQLTTLVSNLQNQLGSKFVYKDCMAEMMKIGNAQVNIVEKYMKEWAAKVQNSNAA